MADPVKSASLQLVAKFVEDAGQDDDKRLDVASIALSSLRGLTVKRLRLSSTDTDIALAASQPNVAVIVFSHDNPFKLRIAANETQLDNIRFYCHWSDDETTQVHAGTGLLVDGNGDTNSDLEVWVIDLVS